MASAEDVHKFMYRNDLISRKYSKSAQKEFIEQIDNEWEIITNDSTLCPNAQLEGRSIDVQEIKRALLNGQGDDKILRTILCMNNTLLFLPKKGKSLRIRRYIQELRQIGNEGVAGYAMFADIRPNGKDLFVIKAPKDNNRDLVHEYFIGAYGTNQLRSQIPNFSYILGLFTCSPPYIDNWAYLGSSLPQNPKEDRRALTFCQNDKSTVVYIFYENIPGKTLSEVIEDGLSFEDFMNIFIQIVFALQLAYKTCKFVHDDLHTDNVLIQKLEKPITIKYEQGYIRTQYIPKIIDYGRSHIVYDGKNYGYPDLKSGYDIDSVYPLFDIYKLLMFSLLAAFRYDLEKFKGIPDSQIKVINSDIFNNAKLMVAYFNPEFDLDHVGSYLADTIDSYYSLPSHPEFVNKKPVNFYDSITQLYPNLISKLVTQTSNENNLYGCSNNKTCLSLEQAISEYTQVQNLEDPYIFYDAYQESKTPQNVLNLGQKYLNKYANQFITDLNLLLFEIQQFPRDLISFIKTENQWNNEFLDHYRRFIDRSVKLVDLTTTYRDIQVVAKSIENLYSVTFNLPDLGEDYVEYINNLISSIKADSVYISGLNKKEVLSLNPDAKWLFVKMPNLILAISKIN